MHIQRRAALALLCAPALSAFAQADWPNRPVRLVLPFSAGGPGDITTRLLAQSLGKQLNQTIIVDNKPGAGGIIGSDFVAKSAPDGYTLLVAGNGAITNALLRAKMPYAETDLVPVISTNSAPSVMVVGGDSPVQTLKDLQAYARKRANGLTFGTAGTGSTGHFVAELVRGALDVPVTVVHFKSGGDGVTALMGGQIDMVSEAAVGVLGYVRAGKLRAIAVTDDKRLPVLPNVATTAEQGFAAIRMRHWGGFFAPRGTPEVILQRVAGAMQSVLQNDAQLRAQLEANGYYTSPPGDRAEFERFLNTERQRLGRLVADAKMTVD
jgi:tripartite-type tricarboxylate transporter receptor subunit TctC